MNNLETITPKARAGTLGLEIADDMTFVEWKRFAPHFGDAALALGFAIGDWLLCGERFAPQRALPGFGVNPNFAVNTDFTCAASNKCRREVGAR